MSPEDRKRGVDDFISKSPVADEVRIVKYQTKDNGESFECGECKKVIKAGRDHLLGIVTFHELQRYTTPYRPQFAFHAGCTPVLTNKITFQDDLVEERYKKVFHRARWIITEAYLQHVREHVEESTPPEPKKPIITNPLSSRLKIMEHD